jgi:23S rRNA (guanine745-N1)-methyltransferase
VAIELVLADLQCPVCATPLHVATGAVHCQRGHDFDLARQGYLNLGTGRRPETADTASMVAARERFVGSGHFAPIVERLQSVVTEHDPADSPGLVVDLAGGTGYYLARVLDALPRRLGLCIDLSAPALRRAARAHPRAAALGGDVWQRLALVDHCAAVVLSVFGPRNIPETQRVLVRGGILVVVTPNPTHLAELVEPLGMVTVDERKPERLAAALADFDECAQHDVTFRMALTHADVTDVVAMGPSARHLAPVDLTELVATLADPIQVTGSVQVAAYRRMSRTPG